MKYIILLTVIAIQISSGQIEQPRPAQFVFLPAGLHFAPLKANIQEPHIGVFKFLDAGEMKVDIGNSIDVFGVHYAHSRFTAGIDFFAYAYVTGSQGLRLQIDAIDGYFGGNVTFSQDIGDNEANRLYTRLRILHHSAHLVDGHYSSSLNSPISNRGPMPFTQDFGEFIITHAFSSRIFDLRYYGGLSYATLIRPTDIERLAYLGGLELYRAAGSFLDQPANIFIAYNVALAGTPEYTASNNVQIGWKFGGWMEKGVTLYLAYYNGEHMFAEYFNERLTTIGAGFTVDFF